jgi:hypothetical protein
MKGYIMLAIVLLVLAFPIGAQPESEEKWIKYEGQGMSFEYPESWDLVEHLYGVTVGDPGIIGLSIYVNNERCYSLSNQTALMNLMLKIGGMMMDGTPYGDPMIQFHENEIGPHSFRSQLYKDTGQVLMCEIQGYIAQNATVTYVEARWDPLNPQMEEVKLKLAKLKQSLKVTAPDN